MISLSHWGLFDPERTIPFGAAPIGIIAEVYRLRQALLDNLASTKGEIISGTHLKMIA